MRGHDGASARMMFAGPSDKQQIDDLIAYLHTRK
jgi:cytochrome c2